MSILSIIAVVSGFALWLILPQGQGFRGGRERLIIRTDYLSLERNDWLNIHDWVGVVLIAIVVIHIAVHYKWIIYMTRKLFKSEKAWISSSSIRDLHLQQISGTRYSEGYSTGDNQ